MISQSVEVVSVDQTEITRVEQLFLKSFTGKCTRGTQQSSTSLDLKDKQIHHWIKCNECDMNPISGDRFHCSVCEDYDLCAGCEAKQCHDPLHPLMKVRLAGKLSILTRTLKKFHYPYPCLPVYCTDRCNIII